MDVQNGLGNFGVPFFIEWKDKKYPILYRVQRIKAGVERWAKQQATRDLIDLGLPKEDYEREVSKLVMEVRSGKYSYDSDFVQEKLVSTDGRMAMTRILLDKSADGMSDGDLQELVIEKFEEIEVYMRMQDANVDHLLKDAGWNPETDPQKEKIDPKVWVRCLKKLGLWE